MTWRNSGTTGQPAAADGTCPKKITGNANVSVADGNDKLSLPDCKSPTRSPPTRLPLGQGISRNTP